MPLTETQKDELLRLASQTQPKKSSIPDFFKEVFSSFRSDESAESFNDFINELTAKKILWESEAELEKILRSQYHILDYAAKRNQNIFKSLLDHVGEEPLKTATSDILIAAHALKGNYLEKFRGLEFLGLRKIGTNLQFDESVLKEGFLAALLPLLELEKIESIYLPRQLHYLSEEDFEALGTALPKMSSLRDLNLDDNYHELGTVARQIVIGVEALCNIRKVQDRRYPVVSGCPDINILSFHEKSIVSLVAMLACFEKGLIKDVSKEDMLMRLAENFIAADPSAFLVITLEHLSSPEDSKLFSRLLERLCVGLNGEDLQEHVQRAIKTNPEILKKAASLKNASAFRSLLAICNDQPFTTVDLEAVQFANQLGDDSWKNFIGAEGLVVNDKNAPIHLAENLNLRGEVFVRDLKVILPLIKNSLVGLKELRLEGGATRAQEVSELAGILSQEPQLKFLNLSYAGLRGEDLWELESALSNLMYLKELDLSFNNITAEGAEALADILLIPHEIEVLSRRDLKVLNLEGNEINGESLGKLLESLIEFTSIRRLNIASNKIGADGFAKLAEALPFLDKLEEIDLTGNAEEYIQAPKLSNEEATYQWVEDEGRNRFAAALEVDNIVRAWSGKYALIVQGLKLEEMYETDKIWSKQEESENYAQAQRIFLEKLSKVTENGAGAIIEFITKFLCSFPEEEFLQQVIGTIILPSKELFPIAEILPGFLRAAAEANNEFAFKYFLNLTEGQIIKDADTEVILYAATISSIDKNFLHRFELTEGKLDSLLFAAISIGDERALEMLLQEYPEELRGSKLAEMQFEFLHDQFPTSMEYQSVISQSVIASEISSLRSRSNSTVVRYFSSEELSQLVAQGSEEFKDPLTRETRRKNEIEPLKEEEQKKHNAFINLMNEAYDLIERLSFYGFSDEANDILEKAYEFAEKSDEVTDEYRESLEVLREKMRPKNSPSSLDVEKMSIDSKSGSRSSSPVSFA